MKAYLFLGFFLFFGEFSAIIYAQKQADKPVFRDPIQDGAADPVIIWNKSEKKWFMFYTNRRAKLADTTGVAWVHGTKIGIAESVDGGATWKYRDTAHISYPNGNFTQWAPEVIADKGLYHMYLTNVPGIFKNWNAPRDIVHLTSKNLVDWKYETTLKLASDRVIDACVLKMPDGNWRMWYNNERDRKSIYFADSKDLFNWEDKGKAIGDRSCEAPKVFRWKNKFWMITDTWRGLGVYSSDDLLTWKKQEKNILAEPGTGKDDGVKGGHADVIVKGDRAFVFYFTHPGIQNNDPSDDYYEKRRSSIQVAELELKDGVVVCDRNKPVFIKLKP
jgi:hypothetical protein